MIAKQIAAMILAVESTDYAEANGWLRHFVTDAAVAVNPRFRVLAFLVPNVACAGTITRLSYRADVITRNPDLNCIAGEISFYPFGFVYAYDISPGYGLTTMADVGHWFRTDHPDSRKGQSITLYSRLAGIDSFGGCRGERRYSAQVDFMGS